MLSGTLYTAISVLEVKGFPNAYEQNTPFKRLVLSNLKVTANILLSTALIHPLVNVSSRIKKTREKIEKAFGKSSASINPEAEKNARAEVENED